MRCLRALAGRALTLRPVGMILLLCAGCAADQPKRLSLAIMPATAPATAMVAYEDPQLDAVCMPPAGWTDKGLKQGGNHLRRTWISPSTDVGYGVVRAGLPLPVGESLVLSAFLTEVEKMQGRTVLVEKRSSDEGLIFVAQNPVLHYEGRVHCQGFRGWIVFASSLVDRPIDREAFRVAQTARDATVLAQ